MQEELYRKSQKNKKFYKEWVIAGDLQTKRMGMDHAGTLLLKKYSKDCPKLVFRFVI